MDGKTLGKILKFGRERRGWTQEELARESGVSQKQIAHWEQGYNLKTACSFLIAFLSVCDIGQLPNAGSSRGNKLERRLVQGPEIEEQFSRVANVGTSINLERTLAINQSNKCGGGRRVIATL